MTGQREDGRLDVYKEKEIEDITMLYPFMTYLDGTEIVYSDIFHKPNDPRDFVKILFERPNRSGSHFDSMSCVLPDGKMQDIVGFSPREAQHHYQKIKALTSLLLDCAREEQKRNA